MNKNDTGFVIRKAKERKKERDAKVFKSGEEYYKTDFAVTQLL